MQQEPRRDGGELGNGLGGIGELPCGEITERLGLVLGRRHEGTSDLFSIMADRGTLMASERRRTVTRTAT